MLVFSTKLPLKNTITQENCMDLFIKWIIGSPNYSISTLNYDISSHKDFDCNYGEQTFSIRHYKDENIEISACRLENASPDAIWINDCIFLCQNQEKSLLIQLHCNRTDFDITMPKPHKPYIVRQFVENGYCKDDSGIPITDVPINSDNEYYSTCVKFMTGNLDYTLPIVYVSCDDSGRTALSPTYLARQLSGVAHVFVEQNRSTSLKLREDTYGNNAHNKYIGIYLPGTKFCQKYSLNDYSDYKVMSQEIVNSVWKVLVNKSDSSKFNWNHILTLQSRQKVTELQNISVQDKAQLSDYINTFDEENQLLRNQIDELNKENYSLKAQLDALRTSLNSDSENHYFYKAGTESDLYPGETSDLLYSILSQVQSKYDTESRAYTLIQSLLSANPKIGECERVLNGLTDIFSGNFRLNKNTITQLKQLGFEVKVDGPHYKLYFYKPKYMFSVSKTPSDHREGKNVISQIRNIIDIERKI